MAFFSSKFFSKNAAKRLVQSPEQLTSFINTKLGLSDQTLVRTSTDNQQCVTLHLPMVADSLWPTLMEALQTEGIQTEAIKKAYNIPIFTAKQKPVANVKNIIAVSSGKGGVGKSASAVNLALALQQEGARVGILDADIYGPSVPIMLGTQGQQPQSEDNKTMHPVMAHGLASNSIGYLVQNEHASIWRGPMASKALSQLLNETKWPMLDYLIVDMPPGTGDIQLTMCQQLPITAAVVVTTPQDIALNDAAKGIAMFEKLEVPVLGIIENMSYFECENCHHKTAIFSEKGAQKLSEKYALPLLAQVPLNTLIREYADAGKSLIHEQENHAISLIYKEAAINLTKNLCELVPVLPIAANMSSNIEITRLD